MAEDRTQSQKLSFSPEELADRIQRGDVAWATPRVLEFLDLLRRGGAPTRNSSAIEVYGWWAERIAHLLLREELVLDDRLYFRFARHLPLITDLFGVTREGSTDGVLEAIDSQITLNGVDEHSVRRLLLASSIHSESMPLLGDLVQVAPDLVWPVWLNLLASRNVMSTTARRNREALHGIAPALAQHPLPASALSLITRAWYGCSYDVAAGKHDLRIHLNTMVRGIWQRAGVDPDATPVTPPERDRPLLVIASETLSTSHAMYRAYGPLIQGLREKFQTVLVGPSERTTDVAESLADRVITVEPDMGSFRKVVRTLRSLAPDLVYHPSIGMDHLGIALANLRLARAHVASMGHPGTTHAVDYAVFSREYAETADLFSEKVLLWDPSTERMVPHPDLGSVQRPVPDDGPPFRISIASTIDKLGPEFLATCHRIDRNATTPLQFRFFPQVGGVALEHARRRILDVLPNSEVFGPTDYFTYMQNLGLCRLQLAPFPFGNTSGFLDALHLGIPSVALDAGELHTRTDARYMMRAGLPDWLIASDVRSYVEAALRFIGNAPAREQVRSALARLDMDAVYYAPKSQVPGNSLADLLQGVHEHHETIQASDRKTWTTDDMKSPGRFARRSAGPDPYLTRAAQGV